MKNIIMRTCEYKEKKLDFFTNLKFPKNLVLYNDNFKTIDFFEFWFASFFF